jgi:hypothetical protein
VIDGFWQRWWMTEHGIGKGDNKGGQEQLVGASAWQRGRTAKLEAVGGRIGNLSSFFMGMCGCKAGVF